MYAGIQRLEVQGAIKDYLKIQYSGSDVLYVPVTQLDLLSRYNRPRRRGKGEACKAWRHRVAAAPAPRSKGHRRDGAGAHRALRPPPSGHRLRLPRRRRVAERFRVPLEYDETDDQLTATAEIKKDMEKGWPMDRLLCGDVGVGKTEVAFRAAFKCVMGGKQCAILAPTTLLAWQHYNSIISRMEAFPVKVGLLSRFRTAKQQKETLRGLQGRQRGHRHRHPPPALKDVRFHDWALSSSTRSSVSASSTRRS